MRNRAPLFLLLCSLVLAGCGRKSVELNPSFAVPAAEASLKVGEDDNGNTTLELEVEHLARPERLTPPAQYYVAWLQVEERPAEIVGTLQVDENLDAKLTTVTPHERFNFFITAEQTAAPQFPASRIVFRQHVQRD